ncbi:MAG TPA: hypothetical protein VF711_08045 [Acidimicrobiales bacterium]|jgi:hypothetical protein
MEQLLLLDPSTGVLPPEPKKTEWQLDDRTRAIGRQGLEEARRALVGSLSEAA